MSMVLYELPDRYVLFTGEVAGKHVMAMRRVLAGQSLDDELYWDCDDVERFVCATGQRPRVWADDGVEGTPAPATYAWNIPERFANLDVREHVRNLMRLYGSEHKLDHTLYDPRLEQELGLIERGKMTDFIRALIYMVDEFTRNNVVWGVGRGSSVESLVLYLIGVNLIDPVLNHIPLEHFFRS